MDKENSGNLDEFLARLKDSVENTESATSDIASSDEESVMDTELLKEKLREQFMADSGGKKENKNNNDEYSIDSDLISEFYAESKSNEEELTAEVEEEDERFKNEDQSLESAYAEAETAEINEDEIVEIIIPWVGEIAEAPLDEVEEEEDFGGEPNEDYYDEQNSENSYICFADEETNDEDLLLVNEEPKEEIIEESKEQEFIFDADEPMAENDDPDNDDLPWYEDEIPSKPLVEPTMFDEPAIKEAVEVIEEIVEEKHEEDTQAEISEQETLVEEISVVEAELVVEETVGDEVREEVDLQEESQEEKFDVFKTPAYENTDESEEESSFYRTIIDARTERESEYGYTSVYTAYVDGDRENKKADEEEIEIPNFNQTAYSIDKEVADTEAEGNVEDRLGDDYYGSDEHDVDFEEDGERHSNVETTTFDYESEESDESSFFEAEIGKIWKIAKPVLMGLLTFAILILELLPILNVVPDGILDYTSYPWTYMLIDAQLLIFASALCYNKLIDGLKKLITPEPNLYSVLSVTIIVTLLSSIISCFGGGDDIPRLYNFISAVYLLSVYVLNMIEKKRIKDSIRILSEDTVFTLRRSQGKNSCAEKMYAGGVDPDTSIFEPVELGADSLEGVLSPDKIWKSRSFESNLIVSSAVPVAIFAIFMAVVSIVLDLGLSITVNTISFVFVLLAPLSATVAYYLPLFVSSYRLSSRGCVIDSYEGAEQIADCNAMVFGDSHLFKDCNAKEAGIKLYCDSTKTKDLFVCLGAVYSKIGGPMKKTFSSVLGDDTHRVNMIRITRSGYEAVVDNRHTLIVGSSEYLSRYGIMTDRADTGEAGVIYAALDSTLSAKISVMYRTQPLFEELNDILDEYGVRSVIETYDPMISGKYVAKCRGMVASLVSVVHKNVNDYNAPKKDKATSVRTGAFVTASRLKLVELMTFCKKITWLRKINAGILTVSYAIAALVSILLLFGGGMEGANLLWVLLYHTLFGALYVVLTIKLLPLSFDAMQEKKMREEIKKQEKENNN